MTGTVSFPAIGVDCQVVATCAATLPAARELAETRLRELDAAASRFRPDSEVMRLAKMPANAPNGTVVVPVSPLLQTLVQDALWAAEVTGGLVDPTLGRAMEANGYDADLAEVVARPVQVLLPSAIPTPTAAGAMPVSTLRRLSVDQTTGTVTAAAGTLIDLGATAKAATADRIARELADRLSGGFLVDLGGDIAVAGPPPTGGWVISTDDAAPGSADRIGVTGHGVATSGTDRRRWYVDGVTRHHLLDPTTGRSVPRTWKRVTCVAASALEANTASTAACVLGDSAVAWLGESGIPSRLVPEHGEIVCTPGWPRAAHPVGRAS